MKIPVQRDSRLKMNPVSRLPLRVILDAVMPWNFHVINRISKFHAMLYMMLLGEMSACGHGGKRYEDNNPGVDELLQIWGCRYPSNLHTINALKESSGIEAFNNERIHFSLNIKPLFIIFTSDPTISGRTETSLKYFVNFKLIRTSLVKYNSHVILHRFTIFGFWTDLMFVVVADLSCSPVNWALEGSIRIHLDFLDSGWTNSTILEFTDVSANVW